MNLKNKFLIFFLLFCKNLQGSQLEQDNPFQTLSDLPQNPFTIIKKKIVPNELNNEDDNKNLGLSLKKKFKSAQNCIKKYIEDTTQNNSKKVEKKLKKAKTLDQETQYEVDHFIESGQQNEKFNQILHCDYLDKNVKKWLGEIDSVIKENGEKYYTYSISNKFCGYFLRQEFLQSICADDNLARRIYIKGPTEENLKIIQEKFVEKFMENLDFIIENQKGEKFVLWNIIKNYILSENLYDEILNVKNIDQFINYAKKHKSHNICFKHHTLLSAVSYVLYKRIGLPFLSFSEGVIQSNGGFEYLRETNDMSFFDLISEFKKVISIGYIKSGQRNHYYLSLLSGEKPDENIQQNNFAETLEKQHSNTSKSHQIL